MIGAGIRDSSVSRNGIWLMVEKEEGIVILSGKLEENIRISYGKSLN